jgi:hypothetical protein
MVGDLLTIHIGFQDLSSALRLPFGVDRRSFVSRRRGIRSSGSIIGMPFRSEQAKAWILNVRSVLIG